MKTLFVSFLFLASAFPFTSAEACDAGELCRDKAAIFNDVIQFSRASKCATLSDTSALQVARLSMAGRISYRGFKSAYGTSCELNASISASESFRKSDLFVDAITFSRASSCATLSTSQALQIAEMVKSRQLLYNDFKQAYRATCDYNAAISSSNTQGKSDIVTDIISFSRASSCATLSNNQALQIADFTLSRRISYNDFKEAYRAMCSLNDALDAASYRGRTEIVIDLIAFSRRSRCQTLTNSQALDISRRVQSGENNLEDFKMTYQTSCNLQSALEASRCDQ